MAKRSKEKGQSIRLSEEERKLVYGVRELRRRWAEDTPEDRVEVSVSVVLAYVDGNVMGVEDERRADGTCPLLAFVGSKGMTLLGGLEIEGQEGAAQEAMLMATVYALEQTAQERRKWLEHGMHVVADENVRMVQSGDLSEAERRMMQEIQDKVSEKMAADGDRGPYVVTESEAAVMDEDGNVHREQVH